MGVLPLKELTLGAGARASTPRGWLLAKTRILSANKACTPDEPGKCARENRPDWRNDALLADGQRRQQISDAAGKTTQSHFTCDLAAIFVLSCAFLSGSRRLAIAGVPGAALLHHSCTAPLNSQVACAASDGAATHSG